MSILETATNYLNSTKSVKIAHLVELELPGESGVYTRFTDYFRDITYDGNTYTNNIVKNIGALRQTKDLQKNSLSIQVSGAIQDELDRVLSSRSFLNRIIKVHRVFLNNDGEIISIYNNNKSILFFEGRIASSKLQENLGTKGKGSSTVTWTCTNKLGEFEEVNGRITDDESHRGLINENGVLKPSSASKIPEYQLDKGFLHANNSIKLLAQYQTKEKRYKLTTRKAGGLRGILGQKHYDMSEYWADVTREVDMDINLTAKYLPVIYGVQKTAGIPVFMDTEVDNSSAVWAVYAFCEGEIDGFLDVYFDDKPIVCVSPEDSTQRACLGSKRDRGDTLAVAEPQRVGEPTPKDTTLPGKVNSQYNYDDGNGVISFWLYNGSRTQSANQQLVELARTNKFKLQQIEGAGAEYWDNNFKLTDTAYMVVKFNLNDQRTNIPEVAAEIQGKKVRVYKEGSPVKSDKTSLNFAWQLLDYLTSVTYGAGIDISLIDIPSIMECARLMDIQDTSYDALWTPYWRYLGWENRGASNRAVLQGSAYINTSTSVFKNIETVLSQFGGSLNIVNGKYTVTMEAKGDSVADITFGDIIDGNVSISDNSLSEKFNSVQAAISDPANSWNTTTITFFNKDYKAEDNNKELKANVAFPYITNYYTARTRAEYVLNKSRYSRVITFRLPFKYISLYPNANITLTFPRYKWDKKKLQVQDLRWDKDGSVTVTAREYEDNIFINSDQSDNSDNQNPDVTLDVLPPRELRYTPLGGLPEDSVHRKVPGLNGVLSWKQSLTKPIAYYTVTWTGEAKNHSVVMDGSELADAHIQFPLRNLDPQEYTFEVRAVTRMGETSFPAKIKAVLDANRVLQIVPNFRVLNLSPSSSKVFVGSGVQLAWDAIENASKVTNLQYQLQIFNESNIMVRSLTLSGATTTYTYTRENNIADFAQAEGGALGLYRKLTFRIQATGDAGTTSVDWATI